jgi:hypothetical protein
MGALHQLLSRPARDNPTIAGVGGCKRNDQCEYEEPPAAFRQRRSERAEDLVALGQGATLRLGVEEVPLARGVGLRNRVERLVELGVCRPNPMREYRIKYPEITKICKDDLLNL